ncbi:MAG: permease [Pleomorphochaeta sp.]
MKKLIKNNLSIVLIAIVYITLFIVKTSLALTSVKNSGYYIKEMLMIMPVIFVLTALLDTWIDKKTIMKYLGKSSKSKGVILSFVLGSISAGPIYAAFPICVLLHKKGASIRNIIIILSSWAVIKVPMLINEVKFLGIQFMAVRWVLTIIAILIFSFIGDKIIKDEDLAVDKKFIDGKVSINTRACIGCGVCAKTYPSLFSVENKKAHLNKIDNIDDEQLNKAIDSCPVNALNK